MHELDEDFFTGGLNSDDELRSVPKGDYLDAKNIRTAINQANKGNALTNVLGNLQITKYSCPYNGGTFPTGKNKCIGAVENTNTTGALFFVWNSEGKHGIYHYFRNRTDPDNPFGVVEQVIQYDFGWSKRQRITSINLVYGDPTNPDYVGDLAYWCDKKPRKINFTKGNIVGKLKSWNLYLPQTVTVPAITIFTFRDFAGNLVYQAGVSIPNNTNREAIITSIAEIINANIDFPVTAVACDCSLQLIEKVSGQLWTIETDTDQILVSADNWYGDVLVERFFDRCKYPPLQAPQPEFRQDDNYEPNYVQKKVFQFRLEYIYDDREESALGVWSQIPINNLGCDGTSNVAYNYIDIDFNDLQVVDPTVLVLLKKIRLIARELNTGKDRSVIDLEPCDFLDYANGQYFAHYNFYNDIISSAIDDATAAKIFDDVPLETEAEQMKDNRMIEFNCLTGYNPPACIDAKVQMDFADNPNPQLYKISGIIRVFNHRLDNNSSLPDEYTEPNSLERRGAISYDTAMKYNDVSYPFFGGYFEANSELIINSDFAFNEKRQYLPEGGWPVYAAGTNYFTISRQRSVNDVAQRADGSIDVSTTVNKDLVKTLYDDNAGDMYSNFELNVPNGEYVIRLASHWCSFGDKLGKGFMYNLSTSTSFQKTSTYVWGINDAPIGGGYRYDFEIKVTVAGADVYIGDFIVADLVFPGVNDDAIVYPSHSGYLFDNFGATDVPSLSRGTIVDRALVRNTVFNESGIYRNYHQKITDHNGFFYTFPDVDFNATNAYANRFLAIQVSGDIHSTGTQYYEDPSGRSALDLLYSQTITPSYPHDPIPSHLEIILPTDNQNARLDSSTFLSGTIQDLNGNLLSGVSIVVTHGRVGVSASNGTYSILIWGDMQRTPPFSAPVNIRQDYLIFNLGVSCGAIYPNGQSVYFSIDGSVDPSLGFGANTTTTAPPYSPTAVYLVALFIINETNNPAVKTHKRGGNYIYAARLYDNAGRCCTVVKAFEMYVPFVTEDIGKYSIESFAGTIYPANTFKYGKPSLKWVLAANTVFPTWATTMQWMRTKNSVYDRYLQWVANEVTYLSAIAQGDSVPEIQTSFQNGDAVAIKISIKNIVDYAAQNPASLVSYQYIAGDRVRLMYDRSLNPINGLNDFEVTSYDPTTQSILIKTDGFNQEILSGSLFEVFNPKSVETSDEQLQYEVGEVVKLTNGIPETFSGIFTNGDTYWRGRVITVNDETTKFASAYPVVIEDASVSDFYSSNAQDIGRVGIIDDNFRQVRRPMLLKASNVYIPSTAINGLSAFEPLNETELDRANGEGKRLISVNQTVVAISTVRETSTYIQVVTFQQATQSDGILAVSNQYFGTQYPHAKMLGTDLPASVFVNDGIIFGYHSGLSDVWMYRGDGEQAISDVKMKYFFQQLGNDGVSDAVAVYDRFHEEYMLTYWRDYNLETTIISFQNLAQQGYSVVVAFPEDTPLPVVDEDIEVKYLLRGTWFTLPGIVTSVTASAQYGYLVTFTVGPTATIVVGAAINVKYSLPETIRWFNGNEIMADKRWKSRSDLAPEQYCQIGSDIIAFDGGKVWISDKNPVRNNFFGVQYNTKITPVFNQFPSLMKVWNAIWLRGYQSNKGISWFSSLVTNMYGQLSRLKAVNWDKRENVFYSDFKKDITDTTVTNPILNGRDLRSEALQVELENDFTGEVVLYSVSANHSLSARTTK